MSSARIKPALEKLSGVPQKLWKRCLKFSFKNEKEFSDMLNGMSFGDLKYADHVSGTIPQSGECRIFVAQSEEDGGDYMAHVLTGPVDEYISIDSD